MRSYSKRLISNILVLAFGVATLISSNLKAMPEENLELIVSISPDQVVGVPLIGTPQVLLLDTLSNPVIGYDLAANPITLSVTNGALNPSLLDNPSLVNNGVISLNPLSIRFQGPSGVHTVTAANDSTVSAGTLVSFNGYDILSAYDLTGNAVTTVYSGLPTSLNVEVRNGGSRLASTDPYVKAFFTSDVSGSVKRYFPANNNGVIDTIQFQIENTVLETGSDTLVLVLHSDYTISSNVYGTEDTTKIPVEVLRPAVFAVVPGSVHPADVYAGPDFRLAFEVETLDFSGPIDSTYLSIDLVTVDGGPSLANIYTGSPAYKIFAGGFISYDSLVCKVDSTLGLAEGEYLMSFDFRLISGANVFSLSDPTPASLTVLKHPAMTYPEATLEPRRVAVERETQFAFDLNYWITVDDTSSLVLDAASSSFELIGSSFNTRTNLVFADDTLDNNYNIPGGSPFTVHSGKLIVPTAQLGQIMTAHASFRYRNIRSGNYLTFTISFDAEPVEVIEYPVAQLMEVKSAAHNQSHVNAGQAYQIGISVASQSEADISGLKVKVTSDGDSKFDSLLTMPFIERHTTVKAFLDVVAGQFAGVTETFTAVIMDDSVAVLTPVDNSATINIDSPAAIRLAFELSPAARDSLLERNQSFSLVASYTNTGTAATNSVPFKFSTGGVNVGVPDPTEGIIQNDTNIVFLMTAPNFDTTLVITFDLLSTVFDQNTGLPAPINQLSYIVPLEVASTQAEMQIAIDLAGELLLVPGTRVPVLDLELTNTGSSVQTDMLLNSVVIKFTDLRGDSISTRDYLVSGQSGFFEDNVRLGSAVLGGDRLTFNFDNYILKAGTTRTMQLILSLQESLPGPFQMHLVEGDFDAEFIDERLAGRPIPIEDPEGGSLAFEQQFQSTGSSTEESFVIETNPYNPNNGPVRFAYILTEPSEVQFRIFTLTGDIVHEQTIPLGQPGSEVSATPHMIEWDGRNDAGYVVINGVYLAHLYLEETGQESIIKVAVVK